MLHIIWNDHLCVILFMYLYVFGNGRHRNCRIFPYTSSYIQSHGLPTWGTKVMINGVLKVDERRASPIQSLWGVSVKCSHWKSHRRSPLTRLRPLNPSFRLDFVKVSLNFWRHMSLVVVFVYRKWVCLRFKEWVCTPKRQYIKIVRYFSINRQFHVL